MNLSAWQLWLRRPQNLWVRKALFQVHLWSGLSLGLYVFVVCISGSAIVFHNDLENILVAKTSVAVSGKPLTQAELTQAAQRAYPGFEVRDISKGRFDAEAAEVLLARGSQEKRRLFDPYTGKDMGPAVSSYFRWLHWTDELHGKLLLGAPGLVANGVGGALTAVLCCTGLLVWWPGIASWRRNLLVRRNAGWKRFIWELHGAVGIWTVAFVLMWGLTGAYFVFPDPFRAVINVFTMIDPPRAKQVPRVQASSGPATPRIIVLPRDRRPRTPGQKILRGFSYAHYGNFGGWPVKVLWVVLGLAPPLLFVTGALIWWNRVLRPFSRRLQQPKSEPLERIEV